MKCLQRLRPRPPVTWALVLLGPCGALAPAPPAHAQAALDDRLQAADCVQAMARLTDHEDTATSGSASSPAWQQAWQQKRQAAAWACLGAAPGAPVPTRSLQPPLRVSPVGAAPAAASPVPVLPPPAAPAPLRSVTGCDSAGCWSNDGQRLRWQGGQLLGPSGWCQLSGTVLHCP